MKQLLRTLLLVILITPAGLAMAHSDHGMINDETAVQIAHKTVQQMTFKDFGYPVGKLDDSWKSVKPDDIEVVEVGDGFYVLRITQSETMQSLSMKIAFTGQANLILPHERRVERVSSVYWQFDRNSKM